MERPPVDGVLSRLRGRLQPEPETSAAALTITVAVLALGALVWNGYTGVFKPVPFSVHPKDTPFFGPYEISTHLSLVKALFDARGQSLAHLVMTAGTALVVVLGPIFGAPRAAVRMGRAAGVVVLVAGILAPFYSPGPKDYFFFIALPLGLLLLLAGRHKRRPATNGILGVAALLALALTTLPGFLRPPDLSRYSWYEMTYGEAHWSVVVAPGDLLAEGGKLLVDVRPGYGVLLPVLWGAGERLFGPFSLGLSIQLLTALQTFYLAAATWLFWRTARGRWLFVIPALAAVLPWYHFAHRSLLFPNQSPWRTIGMLIALLALVLLGRSPRPRALALGAVAGTVLLLNPESGMAATVGLATFLYFRASVSINHRPLASLAASFAAGIVVAAIAFLVICGLVLGQLIPLARFAQLFLAKASLLASAGFSGFPWTFDPWPILIFAHALFVLAQSAFAPRAASGFRPSLRAAVAAILVVWFAYYANRPDPWNLSSYYALYGVLVVDLLRYVTLGLARRRLTVRTLAAAALFLTLVLPNALAMATKGAGQVAPLLGPALRRETPAGSALASGAFVDLGPADEVAWRAEYIRARKAEQPVYVTADSYLVPKISGVFSAMPVVDFCWESMTRPIYDRILRAIARSPSGRVYFDAPDTAAAASACDFFYRMVRRDLKGGFEKTGEEQGWEVWTRKR